MSYYSLISSMNRVVPSTLSNGLVSVYKAESNANDSLGTYNGTAIGGVTYTTGKSGNTFNFDGTTGYVNMGDVMDIGLSSWSYSMWFNTNDGIANQILFSKALAASSNGRIWSGFINNRVVFGFQAEVTNVIVTEMNTSTVGANIWYHLVVILDRSDKLKIYLNGTLQGLTVTSGTNDLTPHTTNYNNTHPFRIGAYTASDNTTPIAFFNGKIDEFNIWNRVLTPTEVTELYKCSFGSFYPFPITQSVDSDVCAFITNASITDITQQSAINTLVTDLKGYGIWTKMKAIYPMVGGAASQHKFNLKDPRDLDAAYRLQFVNGWTHSATGAKPNGTDGYADTKLTADLLQTNNHLAFYSRTSALIPAIDMGVYDFLPAGIICQLNIAGNYISGPVGSSANFTTTTIANGFWLGTKISDTERRVYLNGNNQALATASYSQLLPSINVYLGARNKGGIAAEIFSNKECAFASIGDGLTALNVANLHTAVQRFNTTLNRHVGVPYVSDTDAQAFITNAVITNITQANAVNTLVTSLKTNGLWTKMKAIYPFVGGTAAQHRFNLKDPRPVAGAFYLDFVNGWTHSATGAKPNGTDGYANTNFKPIDNGLSTASAHISYYARTGSTTSDGAEIGNYNSTTFIGLSLQGKSSTLEHRYFYDFFKKATRTVASAPIGLTMGSSVSSARRDLYLNGSTVANSTSTDLSTLNNWNLYIGAGNVDNTSVGSYSNAELSMVTIGSGLTSDEASTFYTTAQAFQVALGGGRAV